MSRLTFTILLYFVGWCVYSQNLFSDSSNLQLNSLKKANIIWLGESHGTSANYDIAFDLFSILHDSLEVNYLLIEAPFLVEVQLNKYLETGSDSILNKFMTASKGTFGGTIDLKNYYKRLYEFNQNQPKSRKIRAISIGLEHQYESAHQHIMMSYEEIMMKDTTLLISKIKLNKLVSYPDYTDFYHRLWEDLKTNQSNYKHVFNQKYNHFYYMVRNINYFFQFYQSYNMATRENLIYENLKYRNQEFNFNKIKCFAFWGDKHVYQSATKFGGKWIATRIKESNPEVNQVSFCCLYANSKFLIPKFFAPKVFRWMFSGDYIKSKRANNQGIFLYEFNKVNGTKYLKKHTSKNVTLFKIDDLPDNKDFILDRVKDLRNSEYIQYVILVKNSSACTPLK